MDKSENWIVYEGSKGVGTGKHIVLVSGDEEYRSEEALPLLGQNSCQSITGSNARSFSQSTRKPGKSIRRNRPTFPDFITSKLTPT